MLNQTFEALFQTPSKLQEEVVGHVVIRRSDKASLIN
jgi:hypothetical protein